MVFSKNKALSFYKRFIDDNIDEECYGEESCNFEEVTEKFGHSEKSVCIAYDACACIGRFPQDR